MLKRFTILIIVFIAFYSFSNAQFFPDLTGKKVEDLNYYDYKKAFDNWAKNNDLSKIKGWKWYQRYLWQQEYQINPDGSFPDLRQNAEAYEEMMHQKNSKKEKLQAQSGWMPLGPYTIGKSYDTISAHGNGRLNCVAFHPTNPDVMWVGAPNGGVWKTDNAGQSWTPLTDYLPSIGVSDIAVDPNNPDVLYIASGDMDGNYAIQSGLAMGIFKSTDAGTTWEPTGLSYTSNTFNYSFIRKIIVHPENSNNLVAGGSRGIWKSSDAGETWTYILDSLSICDLKQNPVEPNILFAATRWYGASRTAGIIKSTDFGVTWENLNSGIPPIIKVSRTAVAISPVNPDYIYAFAVKTERSAFYGVYRSTDAGENWTTSSTYGDVENIMGWYDGDKNDPWGQGLYDVTLLCDVEDENKIYVGGVNVWESTDGGQSWDIVTLWMRTFGSTIHADQHYSVYRPLDGYFYICNDGGLYRTKKMQAGSKQWITDWIDRANENLKPGCPGFRFPTEWESLTEGLANTELYRLGLCRYVGGYITGGSQDNSCFYLRNDEWFNYVTNYDGMETMVHPTNPDIIYGASQSGRLCKSIDGSKTQLCDLTDSIINKNQLGEYAHWVTPFAMDQNNPESIYAGYRNLWKSNDGGMSWEMSFNLDSNSEHFGSINILKICETNSSIICFSKPLLEKSLAPPYELWITRDGGLKWEKITEGLPLDTQSVVSIEINGNQPHQIWVSFSGSIPGSKIFRSDDGGFTWTNVSYNLPNTVYYSIVHQDNNPNNYVYAGTHRGVWYINDKMSEWVLMNENLPNNTVNELEISYPDNKLVAATYGRGFWMTDLIEESIGVDENINLKNIEMGITPNPSDGNFKLILNNLENIELIKNLNLEIVDVLGHVVHKENLNISNTQITHNLNLNLLSGQYYVKVSYGNRMKVRKLVVSR
ncbi:MAG: T9SS type A sorting domain-containing protein [bacterium]